MKAYLLARVSTEDQSDALPAQEYRLKAYADKMNFDWEYHQIQESAYSGDRKQFRTIVQMILKEKQTVAVVFDKIDRLTRDPTSEEYIQILRMTKTGRIDLHFPSDNNLIINQNSSAMVKMILNFGVGGAEYYSASSSDNVKRRFDQMWSDGLWTGAAPFGYSYSKLDGKKWIVPDSFKAEVVRYTFEEYATGTSSILVLRESWAKKFGLQVHHSVIERVLKRPFYYGQFRVNGRLYEHNYEKLISKALFDQVQLVLQGHQTKPHRWAGIPFPYRGLISCSECGSRVTFEIKKGKYIYGHCTQWKYKHDAKYVNEKLLTKQFQHIFANIQIPEDVLEAALIKIASLQKASSERLKAKRDALTKEMSKIDARIESMYDDKLDGFLTVESYRARFEKYTNLRTKLSDDLHNIELLDNKRLDDFSHLLKLSNNAATLFNSAENSDKRKLIKIIISNLELDDGLLRWKYKKPFDLMASCKKLSNWCPLSDELRNFSDNGDWL